MTSPLRGGVSALHGAAAPAHACGLRGHALRQLAAAGRHPFAGPAGLVPGTHLRLSSRWLWSSLEDTSPSAASIWARTASMLRPATAPGAPASSSCAHFCRARLARRAKRTARALWRGVGGGAAGQRPAINGLAVALDIIRGIEALVRARARLPRRPDATPSAPALPGRCHPRLTHVLRHPWHPWRPRGRRCAACRRRPPRPSAGACSLQAAVLLFGNRRRSFRLLVSLVLCGRQ